MEFKLNIGTDNAAFTNNAATEIARILREVAERVENGENFDKCRNILDINGDVVGVASLKLKDVICVSNYRYM